MKNIKEAILSIDAFGTPIELILQSENKFRTLLGGLVSLFLAIIFSIVVIQGFYDLFQRSQFQITSQPLYEEKPTLDVNFGENFMIGLGVLGITHQEEQLLDYQFIQKRCENNVCNQTEQILTQCPPDSFASQYDSTTNGIRNFDRYRCIRDQYVNLVDRDQTVVLNIGIKNCSSFKNISDCVSTRNQLLDKTFYIQLMITDKLLNPYSDQVLQPFTNRYYKLIVQPQISQFLFELYLQNNLIQDDKSLFPFVSSVEQTEQLSVSQMESRIFELHGNDPNQIGVIQILPSYTKNLVTKKYYRIDQMMAYFGGLMKLIFYLFGVPMIFYNNFSFYVFLANNLYTFNVPIKEDYLSSDDMRNSSSQTLSGFSYDVIKQKIASRVQRVKDQVMNMKDRMAKKAIDENKHNRRRSAIQGDINLLGEDEMDRQLFLDGTFSDLLSQDAHIKMAFSYLISRLFCKKICFKNNIQNQLIDSAVDMISTEIDILVILDRMHEIDKLKSLLLTDTQIQVFDYMPKPVIRAEKTAKGSKKIRFKSQMSMLSGNNSGEIKNKPERSSKSKTLQDRKLKFESKEAFQQLYLSYMDLTKETQSTEKEEVKRMNMRLKTLLGRQLIEIFETSLLLYDRKEHFLQLCEKHNKKDRYSTRRVGYQGDPQTLLMAEYYNLKSETDDKKQLKDEQEDKTRQNRGSKTSSDQEMNLVKKVTSQLEPPLNSNSRFAGSEMELVEDEILRHSQHDSDIQMLRNRNSLRSMTPKTLQKTQSKQTRDFPPIPLLIK